MNKLIHPSGDLQIVLTDTANQQDRDFVRDQLRLFNTTVSEYHRVIRETGLRPLDVYVRNEAGEIVGGLTADTYWDWLDVQKLWINESFRGRGVGKQLLAMAEAEARVRGCLKAQLRTFSFQARGFYEKFGYRIIGALEDYPPGSTFFWMRKDLIG